jgi:hypothetical protein
MSQLILNIQDNSTKEKILWMLEHFKSDGLIIEEPSLTHQKIQDSKYTDEYLKENWKEMIMTSGDNSDYYKSEQYDEDRGNYLMEKYK